MLPGRVPGGCAAPAFWWLLRLVAVSALANIRRAVHDMRIGYPIAVDNDYAVSPALYFLPAHPPVQPGHRPRPA